MTYTTIIGTWGSTNKIQNQRVFPEAISKINLVVKMKGFEGR